MSKKIITLDLDNVIFDMTPLYQEAFRRANAPYVKPTNWDLYKSYDNIAVIENLSNLFGDDLLYSMPVLDKKIHYLLNDLLARPDLEVLFVTERKYKQPEKTFNQLRRAGIKCSFNQVYDQHGKKSDILKDIIKPDMHYDDGPLVVSGCLDKGVPVTMISNNRTLYNHYLRDRVQHYDCLRRALKETGVCNSGRVR